MTRIRPPSQRSAHLSLWLGLLGAVVLATGFIFFGYAHGEKKRAEHFNWRKPIPSDANLKIRLTEEQYHVTRENGTETLFHNAYWNNFKPGIYVDIISGEPLFSSLDKFDSGLGLPSFSKPISNEHVTEATDSSHDMQRTEVRASHSNSHLGHLFADPRSPTGQRYTVNSSALRFIPADKLEEEGYGDYVAPFQSPAPGSQ